MSDEEYAAKVWGCREMVEARINVHLASAAITEGALTTGKLRIRLAQGHLKTALAKVELMLLMDQEGV